MQVVSLILAGGKSSRMGCDKARLSWQGQTLLSYMVQVARGVTEACYVITPWPERYHAQISGAGFIPETNPGQGALGGFAQGLAAIAATHPRLDWLLLLACDLPCLEVALLQQWGQHLEAVEAASLAVVPYYNDRWEPLCAFYRPTILPCLQQAIACNQRSFQALFSTIPCQPLTLLPEHQAMLRNCNTPGDWQGALQKQLG